MPIASATTERNSKQHIRLVACHISRIRRSRCSSCQGNRVCYQPRRKGSRILYQRTIRPLGIGCLQRIYPLWTHLTRHQQHGHTSLYQRGSAQCIHAFVARNSRFAQQLCRGMERHTHACQDPRATGIAHQIRQRSKSLCISLRTANQIIAGNTHQR